LGSRAVLASLLAHLFLTGLVFLELDPRGARPGALEIEEQGFDIVFNAAPAASATTTSAANASTSGSTAARRTVKAKRGTAPAA
jgi:hypothetical protein